MTEKTKLRNNNK